MLILPLSAIADQYPCQRYYFHCSTMIKAAWERFFFETFIDPFHRLVYFFQTCWHMSTLEGNRCNWTWTFQGSHVRSSHSGTSGCRTTITALGNNFEIAFSLISIQYPSLTTLKIAQPRAKLLSFHYRKNHELVLLLVVSLWACWSGILLCH